MRVEAVKRGVNVHGIGLVGSLQSSQGEKPKAKPSGLRRQSRSDVRMLAV